MGAYNDDVLFIHIPKTAGWSVKQYMKAVLPNLLMPDDPASKLPIGHVRLADIERFTGRGPSSFQRIVAVVRNPYAQQLSQMAFWAGRYLRGGRHVHDVATWRHVSAELVERDLLQCALEGRRFQFNPRHLNLTGFVSDPECDFHVWYRQHVGYQPGQPASEQRQTRPTDVPAPAGANTYADFGGLYWYWLAVDDQLPGNLTILEAWRLDRELPLVLAPYAGRPAEEMPGVEHHNTSAHAGPVADYYTPLARQVVREKAPWAFRTFYDFDVLDF